MDPDFIGCYSPTTCRGGQKGPHQEIEGVAKKTGSSVRIQCPRLKFGLLGQTILSGKRA